MGWEVIPARLALGDIGRKLPTGPFSYSAFFNFNIWTDSDAACNGCPLGLAQFEKRRYKFKVEDQLLQAPNYQMPLKQASPVIFVSSLTSRHQLNLFSDSPLRILSINDIRTYFLPFSMSQIKTFTKVGELRKQRKLKDYLSHQIVTPQLLNCSPLSPPLAAPLNALKWPQRTLPKFSKS